MKKQEGLVKFLLDFIPIILFFIAYNMPMFGLKPIVFASLIGAAATIFSIIFAKIKAIKSEKFALYSNIAFIAFALLTVIFDNPNFIKAKLTILNGFISAMLLLFYIQKKPVISKIFAGKIEMEAEKWHILTLRFAVMFFLISVLNFYFWQFTAEEVWVKFKTFGVLPFIFIFFAFQMRFIMKNGRSLL